ncbi:MAG: DUF4399 domain-containing protein [Actinomycetota bacterium]
MRNLRYLLAAALLSLLVGCGQEQSPTMESTRTPGAQTTDDEGEQGNPTLDIASPSDGTTVSPGDVEVKLDVANFDVVDKLGEAASAGEGHIHFYIDVDELPTEAGKPAVTADTNTYHAAQETSHTWKNVAAGEHVLGAQLVNNDHTPLDPPVTAKVKVMVQ